MSDEQELKPMNEAEVEAALAEIASRSFSARNPELGKMIKCQYCGRRHREVQQLFAHTEEDGVKRASKLVGTVTCSQVFTYRVGDYEYFREEKDEAGETMLVPAYRTAVSPDAQPTMKQILGQAAFKKKRIKSHPSKLKLRLIEVTREVFVEKGFSLDEKAEQFQKDLAVARKIAGDRVELERKYRNRDPRRGPKKVNLVWFKDYTRANAK